MRMVEIIPTAVSKDAGELAECAEKIRAIAPCIHIDVDDGVFASPLTWPYESQGMFDLEARTLANIIGSLYAEVHLMVEEPREIGIAFARAGAHRILGHVESFSDVGEARLSLGAWRDAGASEVGLGILLDTPLSKLDPLIPFCDFVHVMSIASIGIQGIPYSERAIPRIQELHSKYPELVISVDGGVSPKNIAELVRAGARRFGVGSAISKSADPKAAYENLKHIAENALE